MKQATHPPPNQKQPIPPASTYATITTTTDQRKGAGRRHHATRAQEAPTKHRRGLTLQTGNPGAAPRDTSLVSRWRWDTRLL
ncbi:Hypothetical predicted protein, partial [Pelobates cultripes]